MFIIGVIVVGALFSLIYYTTAQVSSKTFSYNPAPNTYGSYNSLSISDVDGLVTIVPWTKATLQINGTITAKGLGSSLSTVAISNSSNNGDVAFQAFFPVNPGFFFSQSYSVTVNVFIPSTTRFASVQVSNVNGGVKIYSLNSTIVRLTTMNGAISLDCLYCSNVTATSTNANISSTIDSRISAGTYNLTATNANVAFYLSASSSFKVTATVANGSIQVSGFAGVTSTNQNSFSHTFGSGGANVTLKSVNGQITIAGT